MKVLFNTYPMAFDTPGGGERQLMAYYRHLPQHGVQPTLFDLWEPRFREHDLVHFFSVISGSVHFCNFVKGLGLPLVLSTNLWVTEQTKHHYPHDEIRSHLELADAIVVNAPVEADALSGVYRLPRSRFHVIYNGVEEDFFSSTDPRLFRERFGIGGPFLLNVANVEPRKNQLEFIRALKRLPALKLVLVGHVRDAAYAEACKREGGKQLVFVGPLLYNSLDLRSAMAGCELFVMPSTLETPSIAALEAGAQGARVLVTEVGSAREYFAEHATYFDPNSVESMAEGVTKALGRERTKELSKLIRARFTWARVTADLADCYRSVARGAG